MASASTYLQNVELHFVKCNPGRPSTKMDPNNPQWECQVRTTDLAVKDAWEAQGFKPKFQIPKGKGPADGFYRMNFSKRAFKKDGSEAKPVEVVTGNLQPLNPDTIGNGSVGNLRLLSRDALDRGGQPVKYYSLAGIQVTRLKPYTPTNQGFGNTGYEVDHDEDAEEAKYEGFQQQGNQQDQGARPGAPVNFTPPVVNPARSPDAF